MDKYKSLLGNTAIFTISRIGTKLIVFFLVPLYTAYLTTSELGTAELVVTTVEIAIPILTLGIKNAVFRFAFDKEIDTKELMKCFFFIFLIAGVLAAIISIALIATGTFEIYGKWFFFLSMLTAYNETYGLYLKARDKTLIFAIDGLVYVIILALSNICFLKYLRMGITGYLLAIVIAKTISIFYMFVFGKEIRVVFPRNIDRTLLTQMVKYAFPLIASTLAWWVISYADRYMLGIQVNMSAVGIYTVASKIPSMVTTFNMIVMDAWVISYIGEHKRGSADVFYKNVFDGYNSAITALTACIMLVLYPFMHIYVSKEYYGAIEVIPMLLLGALFLSYASFVGVVFSAEKKSSIIMSSSLIAGAWNIGLNFILIPKYEMYGAAFATLTAYMLMAAYRFIRAKDYVRFKFELKDIASVILLFIQMIAVTLKWHNYIASVIIIVLIIVMNINSLIKTTKKMINVAKSYITAKKD